MHVFGRNQGHLFNNSPEEKYSYRSTAPKVEEEDYRKVAVHSARGCNPQFEVDTLGNTLQEEGEGDHSMIVFCRAPGGSLFCKKDNTSPVVEEVELDNTLPHTSRRCNPPDTLGSIVPGVAVVDCRMVGQDRALVGLCNQSCGNHRKGMGQPCRRCCSLIYGGGCG